jgi:hypothetical protein
MAGKERWIDRISPFDSPDQAAHPSPDFRIRILARRHQGGQRVLAHGQEQALRAVTDFDGRVRQVPNEILGLLSLLEDDHSK